MCVGGWIGKCNDLIFIYARYPRQPYDRVYQNDQTYKTAISLQSDRARQTGKGNKKNAPQKEVHLKKYYLRKL